MAPNVAPTPPTVTPNWKQGVPSAIGDRRKLVTLQMGDRIMTCVRVWDGKNWIANTPNEVVLAWDDIPAMAFQPSVGLPPNISPAVI